MKFLFLAIAILGIAPLTIILRTVPAAASAIWLLVGFLPFLSSLLRSQVALLSRDDWLGHTLSADVALLDIICLALLFSCPNKGNTSFPHAIFLLFIGTGLLSVVQAEEPSVALFFVWQCMRVYLVAYVVARYAVSDAVVLDILKGMAIGLSIQAVVVAFQKFALGYVQPPGTFIHQNLLGFLCHFVIYPNFMLLLGGRKELQSIAAPLGGALIAAASASRGAMGFTGLGLVLTYIVSLLGRGSGRKAAVGVAGALALVALVPIAIGSIDRRLELGENPFQQGTEYDDREALNNAAMLILQENPFGVGANHYVYSAFNDGYALRGGVLPLVLNLQTHVHNAYLLVGAEMGWPGLVAFLLLLGVPSGMAVYYGWRARKTLRGQLLLSFAISIMVLSLHSLYEWIIYSVETQYMLAMTIGMVAGLVQQIRSQPKAPS